MKSLYLALFLLLGCALSALSQNVRVDGVVQSAHGPAPNVFIAVCSQPANLSVTPCATRVPLCSSLTDVVCTSPNPVNSDGLGNYFFYIPAGGTYTYQFYGNGLQTRSFIDQQPGSATATGAVLLNPGGDQTIIGSHQLINRGTEQVGPALSGFDANIQGVAVDPASGNVAISGQSSGSGHVGVQGLAQGLGAAGVTGIASDTESTTQSSPAGGSFSGFLNTTGNNTGTVRGLNGFGLALPSIGTTVAGAWGQQGNAANTGPGTVSILAGFVAAVNGNQGGGTVTNSYGYDVPQTFTSNLIGTTNAAYHSKDMGAGANNFGIQLEGVTHNQFGGGTSQIGGLITATYPFIDPRSIAYGNCKGDGTDSSAAATACWQAAETARNANGGTIICVAPQSWTLNSVALHNYAHIIGTSDAFVGGCSITPGASGAAFVSATPLTSVINEVSIEGVHFQGGVNPIDITWVNGLYLNHLTFTNYSGNAITVVQGERHILHDINLNKTSTNGFATFAFADCSKTIFTAGCAAALPSPDVDRQEWTDVHQLGSLGSAGFADSWFVWNGNIQGATAAFNNTCFFSCTVGVANLPVFENNGVWVAPIVDNVGTVGSPEPIGINIGQCYNTNISSYNPSFGTTHMTTQIFFGQAYGCTLSNSQLSTSVDNVNTFAVVHGNTFVNQDVTLLNVKGGYFDQNATGAFKVKIIGGQVTPNNALGGQQLSDQTGGGFVVHLMCDDNGSATCNAPFGIHRATGGFGYGYDFKSDGINFAIMGERLFTQANAKLGGVNANAPTAQIAAQEFFTGVGTGGIPGGMTTADIAIEYGGSGGGFRHWLRSVHDPTAANNALKFYVNTSGTAAGSSTPGTGNALGLTITSVGPKFTPLAFASLPACAGGTEGLEAAVTDSTTATWGATVTGGSTNHIKAYCDGTNWTVEAK